MLLICLLGVMVFDDKTSQTPKNMFQLLDWLLIQQHEQI